MFLPLTNKEGIICGHCQLLKGSTKRTVYEGTFLLVYAKLSFVLFKVAGPPDTHPEVLGMTYS